MFINIYLYIIYITNNKSITNIREKINKREIKTLSRKDKGENMKIALILFLHENKITLHKFAEILGVSKTRASKKLCGVETITKKDILTIQEKIPKIAVYGNKIYQEGYYGLKIHINLEENKEYYEGV